jgi:hypothetical protein
MAKKVIKINTNPVPKVTIKHSYCISNNFLSIHAWNSREGTGPYGQPTFDNNKKVDNIKINSNPNTKSGKTRIGKLAGGFRGGIGGGGMNWQTK